MNGVGEKPNKLLGTLQGIHVVITVVLAILTFLLSRDQEVFKQKTTIDQENFKQEITTIETRLKIKQDDRAKDESNEKLRFQLFMHVVSILDKKENTGPQRLAGKSLVTSLLDAEDILRTGLLQALSDGADNQTEQKINNTVRAELTFRAEEEAAQIAADEVASKAVEAQDGPLQKYIVDVFTCEKDGDRFKREAAEILALLKGSVAGVRPRVLYESVNASPGYRVSGLQLRYTPDEEMAAKALAKLLSKRQRGDFSLRLVKKLTPNYLSTFLCS